MASAEPVRLTQIYTPVRHDDGRLLVQIMTPAGELCGWADGRGKYDITGEWAICNKWAPSQSAEYARRLESLREFSRVYITKHSDGVSRVVTSTI